MIQIDWQSRIPIYEQLVKGIVRLKMLGMLSPDEQLPSVRSLAADLGVNPNTVQKAYQLLEARGIIYSVTGKGSFLSSEESAESEILLEIQTKLRALISEAAQLGIEKEAVDAITQKVYEERSASK